MENEQNKDITNENAADTDEEVIGVQVALTAAQKKAAVGDYTEAKRILEETIERLENSKYYNDTKVQYHTFAGPIEQIIFLKDCDKTREYAAAPEPFATLYLTYGNLLMGMEDFEGAKSAMENAIRWNPVNPNLKLEYADVFRAEGDTEAFFETTLDALTTAYTKDYLGHIYRNIGYYFIEKEKWREAMAAYVLSLHFDSKSEDAAKEIDYIQSRTEGKTGIPSMDEIRKIAGEEGFTTEANESIVGIAAFYGHKAKDDGRNDVAEYFLSIAYELTGDSNIKDLLDEISDEDTEGVTGDTENTII